MVRRAVQLAPSVLTVPPSRLAAAIATLRRSGVRYVHVDVMDGKFVPTTAFRPALLERAKKAGPGLKYITHLMVRDLKRHVEAYARAGADYITVHYEAAKKPDELEGIIRLIKQRGKKAGVAINPGTRARAVKRFLKETDLLLIMTVRPGKGGQRMIKQSLRKIKTARKLAARENAALVIEVDGGVKADNVRGVADAGADIIVAGSAVFGSPDPARAIAELRKALAS